jgi:hypothetical protein
MSLDKESQNLALLLALHCVRNTIIEDYHATGKLTDLEMKAFNKEVVNKLYTALQFLGNPKYESKRESFLYLLNFMYPNDWDKPEMDAEFLRAVKLFKPKKKQ